MASAAKYLSNVAKSVKYASIDVLKSYNPVITDMIETNEDVSRAVYTGMKNYRRLYRKTKNTIRRSEIDELAVDLKHNIVADLKSGKFYNKEREEKAMNDAVMGADLGFDDADFGFGDDDLGFGDDSDMGFDEDVSIADTLDSVSERASSAINNVSLRTAEYQVEANRQSTNAMIRHLSILNGQIHGDLAGINSNLGGIMTFQNEAMRTHMENSKTFYETQQKQMDEQTSILKEMLDIQKKTAGMIEKSSGWDSDKVTVQDIFTSEGGLDLKAYGKYIKNNATEGGSEIADMFEMVKELNLGKALVANPIGMLATGAIKSFLPKVLKNAMTEMNDTIAGGISTALLRLTKAKDSDNSIMSLLGNIFGLDLSPKETLNTSDYVKGQVPWTGVDHKALTDVIPTLLGKIYSSVSGSPDVIYDYENGKFTTRKAVKEDYQRMRDRYYVQANDSILEPLDEQIQKVNFKTNKRKQQFLDNLEKMLKYNFEQMADFNPYDDSLSAKTYGFKGTAAQQDKDFELIQKMYRKIKGSKQLRNNSDLIDSVNSLNSWMKSIEESGYSPYLKMDDDFEEAIKQAGGRKKVNTANSYGGSSLFGESNTLLKKQLDILTSQKLLLSDIIAELQDNGAISIDNTAAIVDRIDWYNTPKKERKLLKRHRSSTFTRTSVNEEEITYDNAGPALKKKRAERQQNAAKKARKAANFNRMKAHTSIDVDDKKRFLGEDVEEEGTTSNAGLGYGAKGTADIDDSNLELEDNEREKKENEPSFIDRARKAKTPSQKLKALLSGSKDFAAAPLAAVGLLIKKADRRVYDLFFKKGDQNNKNKSITDMLEDGFDDFFDNIKDKASRKLEDIKDMFTSEGGIGERITKAIDDFFDIDSKGMLKTFKEAVFGDANKGLGQGLKDVFVDGVKDMWKDVKDFWKPATEVVTGVKTEEAKTKSKNRQKVDELLRSLKKGVNNDDALNPNGEGSRAQVFGDRREEMKADDEEKKAKGKRERAKKRAEKNKKKNDKAAAGIDRVTETGVVAVSKGELILPPDLNPFNIKKREKNENKQINRFKRTHKGIDVGIPKFATGGTVDYKSQSLDEMIKNLFGDTKLEDIDPKTLYNAIISRIPDGKQRKEFINSFADKLGEKRKEFKAGGRGDYVEGQESLMYKMGDELNSIMKDFMATDLAKEIKNKYGKNAGDRGKQFGEVITDTTQNLHSYMPSIAKGGIAGALLAAFIPVIGIPLGTALGAGAGLAQHSEAVQNMLFGKLNEETGERDGSGILNKSLSEKVEKYFPGMAKGATVGAITSILPFVPGGPLAGIMVGSAVGFARTNEQTREALFGEGKALSKMGNYLKEKLPRMGLGAAAGFLAGPFGPVTNLMLGAGIGMVSDTNKFKDLLLGTEDENGERHGGLIGFAREALDIPLKGIKNQFDKTVNWFNDAIIKPFAESAGIFNQSLANLGTKISDYFKDKISTHLVRPVGKVVNKWIVKPIEKVGGGFMKMILGTIRGVVGAPFRLINKAARKVQEGQLTTMGMAENMDVDQRMAKRDELVNRYANQKKFKRQEKINKLLGHNVFDVEGKVSKYKEKIYGNEYARNDKRISNMSIDEMQAEMENDKKILPAFMNKKLYNAKTRKKAAAAYSRLDEVLLSDLNKGAFDDIKWFKAAKGQLAHGNYENVKTIIDNHVLGDPKLRSEMLAAVDAAAQKAGSFEDAYQASQTAAAEKIEATGIEGSVTQEGQRSLINEINRRKGKIDRGLVDEYGKPIAQNSEEETQDSNNESEVVDAVKESTGIIGTIAESVQNFSFADSWKETKSTLKDIKDALIVTAFPNSKKADDILANMDNRARVEKKERQEHGKKGREALLANYNAKKLEEEKKAAELKELAAKKAKEAEEKTKTDDEKQPNIDVTVDAADLAENGASGEMKKVLKKSWFGSLRSKASKFFTGKSKKNSKSVITAMGPIKTRYDKDGNEIPDERDSETKETLKRQSDTENTQKGILGKISEMGSNIKSFFTGEDDKKDKKKTSTLGKILKVLGIVGAGVKIGAGVLGGLALAGTKVNSKKRDKNGAIMTDANGNPIMEKKPLLQCIVEAGQRVWMGDDLTGTKSGMYYHIKKFTRDKVIPAIGTAIDYLSQTLPQAIETGASLVGKYLPKAVEILTASFVKNIGPILAGLAKGIVSGLKSILSKDSKKDTSEIDNAIKFNSNGSLSGSSDLATGKTSANSLGGKFVTAMQSAFDSGKATVPTVSNTNTNTTTTSSGSTTATTSSSTTNTTSTNSSSNSGRTHGGRSGSIGGAITTASSKAQQAVSNGNATGSSDVENSLAYQNATKLVRSKAKDQLAAIWNNQLGNGQTVGQLLNDDQTVIGSIETEDGKTQNITGADLLRYPGVAKEVLGIDVSPTNEERDANTNALNRNSTWVGRQAKRLARTYAMAGANTAVLRGIGKAGTAVTNVVGHGLSRAGQTVAKLPGAKATVIGKVMQGTGGIINGGGKLVNATTYGWGKIGEVAKDVRGGKSFREAATSAIDDIGNDITGGASKLTAKPKKRTFTQRWKDRINTVKSLPEKAKNIGTKAKNIGTGVKNFVKDPISAMDNALGEIDFRTTDEIAAQKAAKNARIERLRNHNSVSLEAKRNYLGITGAADDVAEAAAKGAANVAEEATDTKSWSKIKSKLSKIGEKGKDLAAKAGEKAAEGKGLSGKALKLLSKFKALLSKFLGNSKFLKALGEAVQSTGMKHELISKACEKGIKEFAENLTKKYTKGLAKVGAKAIAKVSTKYATYVGSAGVIAAALGIVDFFNGVRKADEIFGVKKPTAIERVVSGLVNVLCETFVVGIILPAEKVVDYALVLFDAMGIDVSKIRERQAEAQAECDKYNAENDTNYTLQEYLAKDKFTTKVKQVGKFIWDNGFGVKGIYNRVKEAITGKKDESVEKNNKAVLNMAKSAVNKITGKDIFTIDESGLGSAEDNSKSSEDQDTSTDNSYDIADANATGTDYSQYATDNSDESSDESGYTGMSYDYTSDATSDVSNANATGTDYSQYATDSESVDATQMATSGEGSIINDTNSQNIQDAYDEINQSVPSMIQTVKQNLASFFGIDASDLNRTTQIGANKYKGRGPTSLFNKLGNMWKYAATRMNPMINTLPKALTSGMSSVSRFLAISLGMASPDDQNIDFTKIVNNQSYLNTRAKRISESSAFYTLFGGVSGNNSNNQTQQDTAAAQNTSSSSSSSKSSGKKGSTIKKAMSKILGLFSGSGSGIITDNDGNSYVDESGYNPSSQYFVSQKYGPYANTSFNATGDRNVTVADAGCAPAVASMAVNSTGLSTPLDMRDAVKDAVKYKLPNQGVTADYFIDEFKKHNMDTSFITSENNKYENTIKSRLKDEKPVILMGTDPENTSKKNSPFGPNSHYVVATKMDDSGNIYINDPEARKPNRRYDLKTVLRGAKLGILPSMKSGAKSGGSGLVNKLKKALRGYNGRGYGSDTVQYHVWNALRAAGYNEITTAATMGNIEAESGFRPDLHEKGGGGFGLIQWTNQKGHSTGRRTDMENYCKSKGKPTSDLQCQIEYMLMELAGTSIWMKANSKYNFGPLTKADWEAGKSIETATKAFMACCERPSYDPKTNHIDKRIQYAQNYYDAFKGSPIDTSLSYNITSATGDTSGGTETTESSSGTLIDQIISQFTSIAAAYGLTGSSDSSSTSGTDSSSSAGGDYSGLNIDGITGATVKDPELAKKQKYLVAKMKSVEGKLKYSWGPGSKYPNGPRDPDQGSGDCSSTVAWAYKNVLGVDPGNDTRAQQNNSNTYKVESKPDESKMQLGDMLLKSGHVEMYAGDGKMIGHGNPKKLGPTTKKLTTSGEYNNIRRWVGFQGKGSGLDEVNWAGSGSDVPAADMTKAQSVLPTNTTTSQTTNKPVVVQQSSSTDTDTINKLIEVVVKLLAQVVDNTGSIKDIAKLMVKLVEVKENSSNSTNSEITGIKRDLVKTKASLTSMLADVAQSQSNQSLEQLISSVEAIAAQ
mgnify:CR=1 FL=1